MKLFRGALTRLAVVLGVVVGVVLAPASTAVAQEMADCSGTVSVMQDSIATVVGACTAEDGNVNPLFIGEASLFSFTDYNIKLTGSASVIGKCVVEVDPDTGVPASCSGPATLGGVLPLGNLTWVPVP